MFSDKFRPKGHRQIVGRSQRNCLSYLYSKIIEQQEPKAIMLTGSSGIGKTTIANIYAELCCCDNIKIVDFKGSKIPEACGECNGCINSQMNILQMNCASDTGIDHIRELISKARMLPFGSRKKVYILDEFHALTKQAQNALLTPLESLGSHIAFVFATTEPSGIIAPLVSRCQRFDLTIPSQKEQEALLKSIAKVVTDSEELPELDYQFIVDISNGNVRTLVNNLELSLGGNNIEQQIEEVPREQTLYFLLFIKGKSSYKEIISCVEKIDDFNREVVILLGSAMKMLKSDKHIELSNEIIEQFGDGLPNSYINKYVFTKRLLACYNARME